MIAIELHHKIEKKIPGPNLLLQMALGEEFQRGQGLVVDSTFWPFKWFVCFKATLLAD